jgi:hypothetical protein
LGSGTLGMVRVGSGHIAQSAGRRGPLRAGPKVMTAQ